MPLNELRQARGLSQKVLAEVLHVQQPSIAKLEKRTDMYISTLRSHIEAMGGQLEVIARFPDGVRIPRHPATQSTLIWPGIPRPSGHLFHGHPAGQSERSDAGVALLVRVGWRRQFLRPFAH